MPPLHTVFHIPLANEEVKEVCNQKIFLPLKMALKTKVEVIWQVYLIRETFDT